MDKELMEEARAAGINPTMYYLLSPWRREAVLKEDIAKEKQRKEVDSDNGQT